MTPRQSSGFAEDSPFCTILTTGRFGSVATAKLKTSPVENVLNSNSSRALRRDCNVDLLPCVIGLFAARLLFRCLWRHYGRTFGRLFPTACGHILWTKALQSRFEHLVQDAATVNVPDDLTQLLGALLNFFLNLLLFVFKFTDAFQVVVDLGLGDTI